MSQPASSARADASPDPFDPTSLLSPRALATDTSGIRKVFDLGASLVDPINLSIGQPDFPVPDEIKRAAIDAIDRDANGYSLTQGINPLTRRLAAHVGEDLGWPSDTPLIVNSGTSGALYLMMHVLLGNDPAGNPGGEPDEIIIPDPYFVPYPTMASLAGGRAVLCDTYPDFRMTAARIEPLVTERTKAVLLNSPSNPAGIVLSQKECREVLELCRSKGVLLVSDEIYDEFTFDDHREEFSAHGGASGTIPPPVSGTMRRCPSPARETGAHRHVLLIRGFGKTYGCTGWRLGYTAGPEAVVHAMRTLQQYTYVCVPTPLQHGVVPALDLDTAPMVAEYARRRDMCLEILNDAAAKLGEDTLAPTPGGAFYLFVRVPARWTRAHAGDRSPDEALFDRLVERNILTIPGSVFSSKGTHLRVSLACPPERLREGVAQIAEELLR